MVALRLALVVLLIGGAPLLAWGQTPDSVRADTTDAVAHPTEVAERITEAFSNADPTRLLSPSADQVEVGLFGTRTFYSRSQSFYVLRNVFEEHPPHRFSVTDVTRTGESCFVAGRYEPDGTDRVFQVYARFVQGEDEAWRLREIRIDDGGG